MKPFEEVKIVEKNIETLESKPVATTTLEESDVISKD